jgi:hypothetical protein
MTRLYAGSITAFNILTAQRWGGSVARERSTSPEFVPVFTRRKTGFAGSVDAKPQNQIRRARC